MDPIETIKTIMDQSLTMDEQYEAIVNLQDWFMTGGFVPKDIPQEFMERLVSVFRSDYEHKFEFFIKDHEYYKANLCKFD